MARQPRRRPRPTARTGGISRLACIEHVHGCGPLRGSDRAPCRGAERCKISGKIEAVTASGNRRARRSLRTAAPIGQGQRQRASRRNSWPERSKRSSRTSASRCRRPASPVANYVAVRAHRQSARRLRPALLRRRRQARRQGPARRRRLDRGRAEGGARLRHQSAGADQGRARRSRQGRRAWCGSAASSIRRPASPTARR